MKKKTLVIGASLNKERYSYKAIHRLVGKDQHIIAIGLRKGQVAGVAIETEKIAFKEVHTVTLYLNPRRQEEYYDYIVNLKPKRVIFNPGTENFDLVHLLKENNIAYEFSCTLVLLATNQY